MINKTVLVLDSKREKLNFITHLGPFFYYLTQRDYCRQFLFFPVQYFGQLRRNIVVYLFFLFFDF